MLLTPVAIAAGRRLAERLFNGQADLQLDYSNIPSVVFSHPPVTSFFYNIVCVFLHTNTRLHMFIYAFKAIYVAIKQILRGNLTNSTWQLNMHSTWQCKNSTWQFSALNMAIYLGGATWKPNLPE